MKEIIERINKMESIYDQLTNVVIALDKTLDLYESSSDELNTLIQYYNSDLWINDFTICHNKDFPAEIKCGVLSEDGVYDLLTDIIRIRQKMAVFAEQKLSD